MLLLEGIEVLAYVALDVQIPTSAQERFDRRHEFGIEVPRERRAWVVGQDAHEHDRIVLSGVGGASGVGEVFSNSQGCFFGCLWAGFGRFDDLREVDDFGSLLRALSVMGLGVVVKDIPMRHSRSTRKMLSVRTVSNSSIDLAVGTNDFFRDYGFGGVFAVFGAAVAGACRD